jgi:hypothetical protein
MYSSNLHVFVLVALASVTIISPVLAIIHVATWGF